MQIKQFEDQVGVALFHRTTRRVELRELAAMELLECIRRKEVDFGIGVEIERSTGFQFDDLFEDPIYAITTKAFPFRRHASVDLAELRAYPVLLNSKSAALRGMLDRALTVRDLHRDIKFEVAHTHTLIALAGAGMGVGILPKVALPAPLKKNLQAVPITNPVLIRTVSIVTLRGQALSPAARALTGAVQKFLKRQT
jgi:DNA-binding transcriptional LysR family regulator